MSLLLAKTITNGDGCSTKQKAKCKAHCDAKGGVKYTCPEKGKCRCYKKRTATASST